MAQPTSDDLSQFKFFFEVLAATPEEHRKRLEELNAKTQASTQQEAAARDALSKAREATNSLLALEGNLKRQQAELASSTESAKAEIKEKNNALGLQEVDLSARESQLRSARAELEKKEADLQQRETKLAQEKASVTSREKELEAQRSEHLLNVTAFEARTKRIAAVLEAR